MSWFEDYMEGQAIRFSEAIKQLHTKQEAMNEDFKWTDELVTEFFHWYKVGQSKDPIEAFKQFKLNSSNKDWEVVKQDYISEGSERQIISVRRISDGEVLSVGDDTNKGRINAIKISAYKHLWFDCGEGVNAGAWAINDLQKAKQRLFTKEQVIGIIEKMLTLNK